MSTGQRATAVYLDHNATTPLAPAAARAMQECYAAGYANPASQHAPGRRARQVLEEAREAVATMLGANLSGRQPDRLIFTSGGTEANNLALSGLIGDRAPGELLISPIEHASVAGTAQRLAARGWRVLHFAVEPSGAVCVDDLPSRIAPDLAAAALMMANNETGVLQPVAEAAELCRQRSVPFHVDAAQAVGKTPVDFAELGCASLSFAAHKFHGPLGIGGLLVRGDVQLAPLLAGGVQQAGTRPGTESVALAVGLRVALEEWQREAETRVARIAALRDRLEAGLRAIWPAVVIHGSEASRLPNTTNAAFVGKDRQAFWMSLDLAGVFCSTGSACASGSNEPSPMLLAMNCPPEQIASSLRLSLGATTTADEIEVALARIGHCLAQVPTVHY